MVDKKFNIEKIRENFPILNTMVHKHHLVYLDNAATTQKPTTVIDTIVEGYTKANANVHRGVHHLSNIATERHEAARRRVASFINAASHREIVFTRGTTEAINLVAFSFGERYIKEGQEILISTMEHHANIVPWQMMAERKGAVLRVIPINEDGTIDIEKYQKLLSKKTAIVAVTHISNVLGTVNPIKQLISIAHQDNIPVLIDGAQSIAHTSVDVQSLDADFFVFSGHKIYAPTGIGVLYGKEKYLDEIPPYMGGGEMIEHVSFEKTTYNELPYKFEAGTPDYIGSTALATALDYVDNIGIETISHHEEQILQYCTNKLIESFDDIYILGQAKDKAGIISFQIGNIHPFDLGTLLDHMGIAIRTGHHCAEPLLHRYGYTAIARASFAIYTSFEEIDQFILGLQKVVPMLR